MMHNIKFFKNIARSRFASFSQDRRGVAAIEFAFIVPVLLVLYFMGMEISLAVESNKKVGRTAITVADLVTQQDRVTQAEIDAIMRIGEGTVQPYNRSEPEIRVTAVDISDEKTPKAEVVWSRKMVGENGSNYRAVGVDVTSTIPPSLMIPGTFLIQVETLLDYKPVITWSGDAKKTLGLTSAFANIEMGETYHLRPRMSLRIPCSDC